MSFSSLINMLQSRASSRPGEIACCFLTDDKSTRSLTYAELDARARAIGGWLAGQVSPGDRVLLLYPPGLEFLAGFFGCLYAQVVAVPLPLPNARTGAEKLALVQADTGARLALTVSALAAQGGTVPGLRVEASDTVGEEFTSEWRDPGVSTDDLAYLQYTSGSTSAPRGVMISHGNVLHNLQNIDGGFLHASNSIAVTWLPHFHDMGLIYGLLGPLWGGFPCYAMSPAAFVQRPLMWLKAITKFRATHSGGPNFAYDLCVRRIREEDKAGLDLSCWELAFNGAEPVHAETLERFAGAFASCGFRSEALYPAYGLAEAALKVSGGLKGAGPVLFRASVSALGQNRVEPAPEGNDEARVLVGCGQPGLDTEVRIVDPETFQECPSGVVGEIWTAGPGIASGYWQRPEETKDTFQAHTSSGEGPFLRTGDLGFLRDGELYIAGRQKDLIIIRGLNHHPSDIELTARRAHSEVASSVGAAFSVESQGHERLVLVMEAPKKGLSDTRAVADAVRQTVAEKHEVQVYAFVLVEKGGVPKTSSGKIQRRLCRSLYTAGKLKVVFESVLSGAAVSEETTTADREVLLAAPEKERQPLAAKILRGHLAAALRMRASDIVGSQPVTSYGLDSLAAMEVQNRVERQLGLSLPAVEMLAGASLDRLAARLVEGLSSKAFSTIPARGEPEAPLSFEQERLWLLDQVSPGNAAFHIPFGVRIRGSLNVETLASSVTDTMHRHESLRTVIRLRGGSPIATVQPAEDVHLPVEEVVDEAEALRGAEREAARPFDLAVGPLVRFRLFCLDSDDHMLVVTMHHVVSDVWSVRLFLEEVLAIYTARTESQQPALPSLPVQYGDFAAWQRDQLQGDGLSAEMDYWQHKLEGAPILDLPTDRPRPARPSFRGSTESFTISEEITSELDEYCRRTGVTRFMVLLAAFQSMLHRLSGQTDVVVGTTGANRNRAELQSLAGFFAAPLVVRTRISSELEFGELLGRVRKSVLEMYAHQNLPFAKVVEAAHPGRQSNYTPLFRVMFSVVKSLMPDSAVPGLVLEPVEIESGATDFDLFINIVEHGSGLRGLTIYSSDLYDASTIQSLVETYGEVLARAVRQPETLVSEFTIPRTLLDRRSTPEAEERPLVAISATFTAEPIEEVLNFWWRELDFDYNVRFAPYNQVFQQLLDPAGLVGGNRSGVNVLLVRLEDWAPSGKKLAKLESNVSDFVSALRRVAAQSPVPYMVCLCPASQEFLADVDRQELQLRTEAEIVTKLGGLGSVHVVPSDEILNLYPVPHPLDPHGDRLGHVPYTPEFFAALGTVIARKVHAMRTAPYKVAALDCDQTLWSGVCGEDGPDGVTIDDPRTALQRYMVAQHDAGMLLALASKNNEEDVWDTFAAHPDMPLRREHFVSSRINWEPKSTNLREMATELQLGLDSFLFVDDSPTECAEVQANAPEVLTLQLPKNSATIPDFLRHVWAFDHLTSTEEDKKRTAMYGQRLERRKLQHRVVTLQEFLDALDLQIEMAPATAAQFPRIAQLTQRTNQMNLTTIRRSEGELHELLSQGEFECLAVHVTDRFGSYGLVGVALYSTVAEAIEVDTLLLSCRALGRGVEHRMVARLGEIAVEREKTTLMLAYEKTAKNRPALDFLRGIASSYETPTENGYQYRIPASNAAEARYNPMSKPGEPAATAIPSATPKDAQRTVDYYHIATELNSAEAVLKRVRAEVRADAASTIPYEAPRTPLERQLTDIWQEMLNIPQIGVNDNFFDLGGHSLLAVQLLSRVRDACQVDLPLDVVFSGNFSVAELAKAIEVFEIEQAGSDEYAALLEELEGLSDEEVRALIEEEEKAKGGGDPA